jgi:hypothetical protein
MKKLHKPTTERAGGSSVWIFDGVRLIDLGVWLSKMILATRSSAKTFSLVVKQAGASNPKSFYGNRRSDVPKKNGSAMTEKVSLCTPIRN